MARNSESTATIEELKDRFDTLNTEKIRLQTQKEEAEKRLKALQEQARENFGTDDLKQLQTKLGEMKQANEKQTNEYKKSLDEIDRQLLSIDESFSQDAE